MISDHKMYTMGVRETCEAIGISRPTLRKLRERGELSYIAIGDRIVRFDPAEIQRFIAAARVPASTK